MKAEVARMIAQGTCAVCAIPGAPRTVTNDPNLRAVHVIGSAFLIEPTVALTNRHVIQALHQVKAEWNLADGDLYLWFVYPRAGGSQWAFCSIKEHRYITNQELDIGLIEFVRRPEPEFGACNPLVTVEKVGAELGEPVAVAGFPHGSDAFLNPDGKLVRVGCLIQQGWLSGVAPSNFVNPGEISELVLDVRTAPGMSGGPVLRSEDGRVIGVHYAGLAGTLAMAIALDQARVTKWITAHRSGQRRS